MGIAELDNFWLYCLCTLHASLPHSADGSTKCPDPVSKTTRNICGAGLPMAIIPEYDVLKETTFPFRLTGTDSLRNGMTIGPSSFWMLSAELLTNGMPGAIKD
mmetsp:Transcript_103321/g.183036  ORF Transcript_103321/g.183036 Transcript_103321/m.183036 type:complete len:103 (+) Transcript_103321:1265-1573(+)